MSSSIATILRGCTAQRTAHGDGALYLAVAIVFLLSRGGARNFFEYNFRVLSVRRKVLWAHALRPFHYAYAYDGVSHTAWTHVALNKSAARTTVVDAWYSNAHEVL